jgi:hypothetical protein
MWINDLAGDTGKEWTIEREKSQITTDCYLLPNEGGKLDLRGELQLTTMRLVKSWR